MASVERLSTEVHRLKEEMGVGVAVQDVPNAIFGIVNSACSLIQQAPLSKDSIASVGSIFQHEGSCNYRLAQQSRNLRIQRHITMKSSSQAWRWLDVTMRGCMYRILKKELVDREGMEWLITLVNDVKTLYLNKVISRVFRPATYGVCTGRSEDDEKGKIVNRHTRRRFLESDGELVEIVVDSAVSIIGQWVGAADDLSRKRAWFVDVMVDCLGEEALYLEVTWDVYHRFRASDIIQGVKAYRSSTVQDTIPFRDALEAHNIRNPTLPEGRLYRLFADLLTSRISRNDIVGPIASVSPSWIKLKLMLTLSAEYIANPNGTFNHRFQQALQRDPDYYQPLREHAPGRIRSRSFEGPYSLPFIRTNAGIFSAITWRALTYNSPFSREHSLLFRNYAHLVDTIDTIAASRGDTQGRKSNYFVNKKGYGQPSGLRKVDNTEKYWRTIQDRGWSKFTTKKPSFTACLHWFRPPGEEASLFPHLGPLGGFHLACDLSYVGVCHSPTRREVAECIVAMNKGARKGLEVLELWGATATHDKEERISLVSEAIGDVEEAITSTHGSGFMDRFGVDYICIEHVLCKLSRAIKSKLL